MIKSNYGLIKTRNIKGDYNDEPPNYLSEDYLRQDEYYQLLRAEKCFEVAIDNRKFEIELLWKRAVIFWGFISVLFVALYMVKSYKAKFALSCVGVVCSFLWTLINMGSKSWQQSWEIKADYFFQEIYKYEYLYKKAHEKKDDEKNIILKIFLNLV